MKKKILSLVLLICMCFCVSACEGEDSIYTENESEGVVNTEAPASKSPKEAKLALYQAYKASVRTYTSDTSYNTAYSLVDIDGNEIPELIYNTEKDKYKVYSYDGKILVYSGGFKTKLGVYTYDGMLFSATGGNGSQIYAKISLDSSLKIYDIGYPYITSENNGAKFTFNKNEITEDEYNTICSSMKELETYPVSDLSHLETLLK